MDRVQLPQGYRAIAFFSQKRPSIGVLIKSCFEKMQQIYRRTPMPKCDFNKVVCDSKGEHKN